MRKLIFFIGAAGIVLIIWFGESRSFFCLENGKCVTVWKTYNHVCYIIPGKYYGFLKPSENYIETTNDNNLTVYFSKDMPNAFIYKSEQNLKVNNADKKNYDFLDYKNDVQKFDKILYKENAKRNNDIKDNAQLMDIIIHDGLALDKNGTNL